MYYWIHIILDTLSEYCIQHSDIDREPLPWVHALHDNLVLLALNHVIGEHGVEVRYGSSQYNPVGAEFVISHLEKETADC